MIKDTGICCDRAIPGPAVVYGCGLLSSRLQDTCDGRAPTQTSSNVWKPDKNITTETDNHIFKLQTPYSPPRTQCSEHYM